MGFTEAVSTACKYKYATFSGRASRSEYWWFQLFYWLAIAVIAMLFIWAAATSQGSNATVGGVAIIGILFALAMFLPQISLHVRRFHDRNISGRWYFVLFITSLIPYLNIIAALTCLVIVLLPGTVGPNKYGPDPLRPEAIAEVFA